VSTSSIPASTVAECWFPGNGTIRPAGGVLVAGDCAACAGSIVGGGPSTGFDLQPLASVTSRTAPQQDAVSVLWQRPAPGECGRNDLETKF
jgi:hypothetical protein